MQRHPDPVPDYTDAFLAVLGLIVFMTFWVIAALAGFLWVAVVATLCHWGLRQIGGTRGRS